jgi:formate dehydrogenase iron-sulfur subunit
MTGKAFFIDTTLCTGCRGCQIACKQWNQLPATKTINRGSHQNPADLSACTWKLIRFNEILGPDGKPRWYFFADQCRHCLDPPCMQVVTTPGAIIQDAATGAIVHTVKLSTFDYQELRDSCPFDIPRVNANNIPGKCTMCLDRVHNGLLPACVKTCPTGAMNFGDRDRMVELAASRLEARKKVNPNAQVTGLDDLRVFYLLDSNTADYWEFAEAGFTVKINRMQAMKRLLKPFKTLAGIPSA